MHKNVSTVAAALTPARFRQLLVLYIVATIAALVASSLPADYSQALADAYAKDTDAWVDTHLWRLVGVGIPLLVAGVVGLVGLFLLKPWARFLSLFTTIASLILLHLDGPTLYSGWESSLWTVSDLLWGAVLAAAYLTPVVGGFRAEASQPA